MHNRLGISSFVCTLEFQHIFMRWSRAVERSQLEWKPWVFIIHGQLESDWILSFYSKATMWVSPWHRSTSCCSVTQSYPTLSDPVNRSAPGFPVLHHLLEFAQTHVHWVSDAIQPSHPLLSPSPAFNLSQHQGLFQWVSSSHRGQGFGASASASVLPMNIWVDFL